MGCDSPGGEGNALVSLGRPAVWWPECFGRDDRSVAVPVGLNLGVVSKAPTLRVESILPREDFLIGRPE